MTVSQNVGIERQSSRCRTTSVPGATGSAQLVPEDAGRRGLVIHFKAGSGEFYLLFASPGQAPGTITASATFFTICLQPGDTWEPNIIHTGPIYGCASVATGNLVITEHL